MHTPAENLKCGNPALTAECTAYGLKSADEIMTKHALKHRASAQEFHTRYPAPLILSEIQVAAICAESYRDGQRFGRDPRPFYDCGGCGHYHPLGWTGACQDNAQRFTSAQLDHLWGVNGWEDVPECECES